MVPKIKTSNSILREIELLVATKRISYIDAALYYCETNNVEPDIVGDVIRSSSVFKQRVQVEAEDLNFLPKANRLPI
jgi:hypothetical protein